MLFDTNDFDLLNLFGVTNNSKADRNILDSKEGFLRGNMYSNEYKPYNNLTYLNLKPKNDEEALLFNIMADSFAINDLNLYLDLHSDDKNALTYFNKLVREEKELKEKYEKMYGPLEVCSIYGNKFTWIDNPWPWNKEDGKYV